MSNFSRLGLSAAATLVAAFVAAAPAQALDVQVSPTVQLGVQQTYTIWVTNDTPGFADDITAGDLFGAGNAVTLDAEPSATYYALFVSAGTSSDGAKRIYVRSLTDGSLFGSPVSFPEFETLPTTRGLHDIEVNPLNGDVYVVYDDNLGDRFLYRIDLIAGTATLVGSVSAIWANDLAFDANGTLWASEGCRITCAASIYTISLTDASATPVTDTLDGGAVGVGGIFGWGTSITYNPDDGLMYVFGEDALLTFDPAGGANPWPGVTIVEGDGTVLAPDGFPMDGIPGAGYLGDGLILYASFFDQGLRTYNTVNNQQATVVTDGVLGPADGFASTNGILPMGHWSNALSCTGAGATLDCTIPRLIPGGFVKLTLTGTVFVAPEAPPANTDTTDGTTADDTTVDGTTADDTTADDTTDTTNLDDAIDAVADAFNRGGGGCTAAVAGQGSADMGLTLLLVGAAVLLRRRKRD